MYRIEEKLRASTLGITPGIGNHTFTISFGIPATAPVSLALYNVLGRKIMTMYEGNAPAGEHKVLLPATKLPSGVYFVTLRAGKEHLTEKFVVTK